jgi:hypothetical protein
MKLTGQRAQVFIDNFNSSNIVVGTGSNATTGGQKYFVIEKGASSTIPVESGTFFIAPAVGKTQITLVTGDRLLKIEPDRFCKTTASFEFAMGSVDVGDDCDPGATISDGILTITGSLAGLFKYDDVTQDFDNVTDIIVNRFLDIVEDTGQGVYTLSPRSDAQIYLLTLLNSGGSSGTIENWLFVPINITSMSMSLGNADPQSKELSFSKGEGKPCLYKRPIA